MTKPVTVFDILREWRSLGDIAKPDTIRVGKRQRTTARTKGRYMIYLSGRRYALHDTLTEAKRHAHRLHTWKPTACIVVRDRKARKIVFSFNHSTKARKRAGKRA